MSKKCGYIALVGLPNAGKSTLLNAILQKKISIVSNKPQTTRSRILGIVHQKNSQMIFLDTPGISNQAKSLSQSVWDACQDANLICYLVDSTRGWRQEDTYLFKKMIENYQKPIFVIGTKIDKMKKVKVREAQKSLEENLKLITNQSFDITMISAKKPELVVDFVNMLSQNVPKSEWYYEPEMVTENSDKFMCSEFIREQLFRQLGDEIPYQTSVVVEYFEQKSKIVEIHAIINVIRESQKSIIIGRDGLKLKAIGQFAREAIETYLNQKVFLKLFVKKGDI